MITKYDGTKDPHKVEHYRAGQRFMCDGRVYMRVVERADIQIELPGDPNPQDRVWAVHVPSGTLVPFWVGEVVRPA